MEIEERQARAFIEALRERPNRGSELKASMTPEARAYIDWLIEQGYAREGRALAGPLGMPTGGTVLTATEAGLAWASDPPSKPKPTPCSSCDHVGLSKQPEFYTCSACTWENHSKYDLKKAAELEREAKRLREEAEKRSNWAADFRKKHGSTR